MARNLNINITTDYLKTVISLFLSAQSCDRIIRKRNVKDDIHMAKSSTSRFYGTKTTRNTTHKTRKQIIKEFVDEWTNKGKESGYGFIKEDANRQPFIDYFLRRVCGVDQPTKYIEYEKDVRVEDNGKKTTKRIDGYIPATKVMWEMKGSNKDLTEEITQSGGIKLTPFKQAWRYSEYLPQEEKPRWIIISNFNEIDIHDMNNPLSDPTVIMLKDLITKYKSFDFMVDQTAQQIIDEKKLSVAAGDLVAKIYRELSKAYSLHANLNDERIQKSLNMLIVRLVFLLYADDTGIIGNNDIFQHFLKRRDSQDIRQGLIELFRVLNTPEDDRDDFLSEEFKQFKYVNGGMFSDESVVIPQFTDELQRLIVDDAGQGFNWSNISPTIFGAVFESTLNPETRREGGMHYTSVENIHKVIDPLFLNDLNKEFEKLRDTSVVSDRVEKARQFQEKLAKIKVLDPACGSGNFLTETYLSLRKLENQCLKIIVGSNSTLNLDTDIKVKIKIQNFYGIEINDFAVSVARTAMWIAESQMWAESQDIIYSRDDFLPLDSNDSIYEGNALRMDWADIVKPYDVDYIMGNPPFVGQSYRSDEQKQDMIDMFGKGSRETKQDYVICWYKKSLDYVGDYKNSSVKCAFVSTNSICQGECVPTFWKDMIDAGVEIEFARRTFIWTNEAKNKAAVHCVIVGYSFHKTGHAKELYDGDKLTKCDHINPYLVPDEDIWINSRPRQPKDKSKMTTGSPATDDGQLFLSPEESKTMSKKYPILGKYIRPFIGAHEFLHDLNERTRYCFWFADVGDDLPKVIKTDHMEDRLKRIRDKRLSSSASRIKKAAETPWLFAQNRQPDTEYLVIPRHSSENRKYIPIGFMDPKTIAGDATTIVYNATLEDFAILESSLHVAWMKTVAGRLKSDYRYSSSVYYNFPMPKLTNELKEKLEKSAQAILDARANHPSLSLADMYKELSMPSDLRGAHRKNDKLILQAYGLNKDATDQDILKVLFKMYNSKSND